jgi:hypothetical protein
MGYLLGTCGKRPLPLGLADERRLFRLTDVAEVLLVDTEHLLHTINKDICTIQAMWFNSYASDNPCHIHRGAYMNQRPH